MSELLSLVFEILNLARFLLCGDLELLQIIAQQLDLSIELLDRLLSPSLPLFRQVQYLHSFFKLLLKIRYRLRILLRQFQSQPQFGGLIGKIPRQLIHPIIQHFLVIVCPLNGTKQFFVFVLESAQRLITSQLPQNLHHKCQSHTCWNSCSRASLSLILSSICSCTCSMGSYSAIFLLSNC